MDTIPKPPPELLEAVETGKFTDQKKKLSHVQPFGKQILLTEVRQETATIKSTLHHVEHPESKRELLSAVRGKEGSVTKLELHHVEPVMKQDLMSDVRHHHAAASTSPSSSSSTSAISKKKQLLYHVEQEAEATKEKLHHVEPESKRELLSAVRGKEGSQKKMELHHVVEPVARH
jgi:hypothetical protein